VRTVRQGEKRARAKARTSHVPTIEVAGTELASAAGTVTSWRQESLRSIEAAADLRLGGGGGPDRLRYSKIQESGEPHASPFRPRASPAAPGCRLGEQLDVAVPAWVRISGTRAARPSAERLRGRPWRATERDTHVHVIEGGRAARGSFAVDTTTTNPAGTVSGWIRQTRGGGVFRCAVRCLPGERAQLRYRVPPCSGWELYIMCLPQMATTRSL